ncbi:transcriptional regulator with XRE-family HTH domain [Actinomadura coerulea]|uniref:Transcriptional regulator with XRE-family HTH domain n=1 Tax=Actinomadura coerulea TaxID=46159 RepID=A0A7X0FUX1_9ACTN|nr:helix-turn-helix domain-containing protein [Actinomadura coerulea]MBB6393622.1 transcriptional regulator with XRE-family HTH domain [Actinomadura coerulea]GGP91538.1 transcriptional regulator [Actinomadura coerulea]
MSDRSLDPADPNLTVGQRIRYYRRRRGMSRDVLGGLIGRNGRWVKAVERGEILQPKLPTLLSIAEALKLRDVARLTGGDPVPMSMFRGPGHPALPAVRDAINAVSASTAEAPPPLAHLQARLDAAWRARHAAPDHRTVLGTLLPDMIRDAKRAVRAYEGADRRRALAILAGVYNLAQFFVAYQPSADLLWRIVERSIMAAEESEDPRAFGSAVWLAAQAHRDAGDFDAAEVVNREGLDVIRPHLDGADDDLRAIWGALHHEVAYTAARAGQSGTAWRWWDRADRIARSLPPGHFDPMTSFSRVIMDAHSVTIAVELRQGGEARKQARRAERAAIPSQPRLGRHLIEVARAWQLADGPAAALGALGRAYTAAPETIRYNGYARRMTLEFAKEGSPQTRQGARNLADRIGLLV